MYQALSLVLYSLLQEEEFSCSISLNFEGANIPGDGVLVIWEWEWDDYISEDSNSSTPSTDSDKNTNSTVSDTEDQPHLQGIPAITHTVTFKCIIATRDVASQETLSKVARLLRQGEQVMVKSEGRA